MRFVIVVVISKASWATPHACILHICARAYTHTYTHTHTCTHARMHTHTHSISADTLSTHSHSSTNSLSPPLPSHPSGLLPTPRLRHCCQRGRRPQGPGRLLAEAASPTTPMLPTRKPTHPRSPPKSWHHGPGVRLSSRQRSIVLFQPTFGFYDARD